MAVIYRTEDVFLHYIIKTIVDCHFVFIISFSTLLL